MKLKGKKAIVTGANQGFGLVVAKAFMDEGADVLIGARGVELLNKEAARLQASAKAGQKVHAFALDVSREDSVEAFVGKAKELWGKVDILVNNAGVYGPKGNIDVMDWQEWVQAVQTNLIGTVFITRVALPIIKSSSQGKIINLSGGGATAPLPGISAYAVTKAAIVRFTETLAKEVLKDNIDVNAVAPGALNTRLLDEVLAAGPEKVGKEFYEKSLKQKKQGGTPLETGAGLCVYLASEESNGITGKLISAVWDPWPELAKYKEELQKTDIYTLRRIVPEDRGKKWDVKK